MRNAYAVLHNSLISEPSDDDRYYRIVKTALCGDRDSSRRPIVRHTLRPCLDSIMCTHVCVNTALPSINPSVPCFLKSLQLFHRIDERIATLRNFCHNRRTKPCKSIRFAERWTRLFFHSHFHESTDVNVSIEGGGGGRKRGVQREKLFQFSIGRNSVPIICPIFPKDKNKTTRWNNANQI